MKTPTRFMVIVFAGIMFMIAATLYGEGIRSNNSPEQPTVQKKNSIPAPVPVPEQE